MSDLTRPVSASRSLRLLWIGTKSPVPTTDGGRLVAASTIEALTAAGVDITLVTPDTDPVPWSRAAWRSLITGRPLAITRHARPALAARVAQLVRTEPFDCVHVEQPQALFTAAPALAAGLPAVLRAHNVEHQVWTLAAGHRRAAAAPLFRLEAARMRRFEASALGAVDLTLALSSTDARTLAGLDPSARVLAIPPPFRAILPETAHNGMTSANGTNAGDRGGAGETGDRHDAETPSCTWIGSAGWIVNDDAVRWLVEEIWPAVCAGAPHARLRLFGAEARREPHRGRSAEGRGVGDRHAESLDAGHRGTANRNIANRSTGSRSTGSRGAPAAGASIDWRPAPADAGDALTPDTILLLPLRQPIGVRMRLLDAWARGVPVVATPAAADGLDAAHERDLLLAADAPAFAAAIVRLAADPALRARIVSGGRATLTRRHDPAATAAAMIAAYEEAIARRRARRPPG